MVPRIVNRGFLALSGFLLCLDMFAAGGADTAIVNTWLRHGLALHHPDPDSAIYYYNKVIKEGEKYPGIIRQDISGEDKAYVETLIRARNYAGNIYYYEDEYNRAEGYYQGSLDIARHAGFREFTANSLYDVGYVRYVTNNFEQAAEMFQESYELFSGTENKQGMFDAIHACGLAQRHLGNLQLADSCCRRSFELAGMIGDSMQVADVQVNYGILLCERGELEEGTRFFEEALRYYENHGEEAAVSSALLNIGVVMKMIGEFDKALSYTERSTEIEEAAGQKSQIAIRYYNLADLYMEMGRLDEAYTYCTKTIGVANEIGARPFVTECNVLLGKYYYMHGDCSKAEGYFSVATDSVKNNNDKPLMANILLWHSKNSLKSGKYADAIAQAGEAVRLSDELQLPVNRKDAALVLSEAYEKSGRLQEAIHWYKLYQGYSDSLNSFNQHKEISRIETKYNYDKKERENELLRNKTSLQEQKLRIRSILTFAMVAGFTLSLIIIILLTRRSRDAKLLFRQQEILNLRHLEELEQELDGKNRELTSKMMFLNQKNEMISRLIRRLQEIRDNSDNSSEEIISIVNELRTDSPQSNWKEFETQFVQVHPGFYQRLFEKHPELTSYEQRICAFLRMNLNTKEISSITGRSAKSIEVTRSRIRTKLRLSRNENLSSYLAAV